MLIIAFALTLLVQASSSPPAEESERESTSPDWAKLPSPDDFASLYPTRALIDHVNGHAVINCSVTDAGALEDCRVIEEAPEGYAFGEASILIASQFTMSAGHGGARVNVPVTWNPPEGPHEMALPRHRFDPRDVIHCTGVAIARFDHAPTPGNRAHLTELLRYFEAFPPGPPELSRRQVIAVRDDAARRLAAGRPVRPCLFIRGRELRLERPVWRWRSWRPDEKGPP